ncbi:hypothetical protein ACFX58_14610 [Sphingomonas sp. NCPPB 2930]
MLGTALLDVGLTRYRDGRENQQPKRRDVRADEDRTRMTASSSSLLCMQHGQADGHRPA